MSKLINKNIIKAMTIGLSAVMTLGSFNLVAFAAESEGDPNTQPANEGTDAIDQGAEEAVTAADAKDTTETALQTIGASVGFIEEAVKAVDEFKEEVTDLISDKQKESDTYQNIIEAAETLEEELTDDYGVEKDGSKDSSENTSNEADDDGKPAGDTQDGDNNADHAENTQGGASDGDVAPAGNTQGEASEGDAAPTEESQGNTSSDDNKPVEEAQGTASYGDIAPAGETVVDEKDADVIEYLEDVRDDLDAAAKLETEIDAKVTEANGYIDDANEIVESKELAELNEQINAFIEKIGTKTEKEAAKDAEQNETAGQSEDETEKPTETADDSEEKETDTQTDNSENQQDQDSDSEATEDTTLIESLEKKEEAVDGYVSVVENATEKEVAEQAVEEARGQKDSAVGEYEDASDELEKLEAAAAAAKANYDDAVGKYNDVKAKLDAKLAEYNSLIEQAKDSAGEADEEIERLKAEAEALSKAVTEAKDSYNTTGYELIAALEKNIQNNKSKQTFANYRELVKNIMQFYYVPDVLGGTFGEWTSDWYKAPGGDWYDNGVKTNTTGNVLNYGHFTYTDAEGNPQEMYINYKTADGNTEKTTSGVIIFEKTEHLVIGNKEKCRDITEDMMDKLDKDGLYVDEEAGFVYVKKDDGSIVRYNTTQGGEFHNGAFNQNQIDDASNYSVVSEEDIASISADIRLTDVYIDKNTENVSYSFENGKLTKTVTADVTTTKYVGTLVTKEGTVEGKAATSFESEDLAKQDAVNELQKKIDALGENETLVIGEKEYVKGDKVENNGFVEIEKKDENEKSITTGFTISVAYDQKFSETVPVDTTNVNLHTKTPSQQDLENALKEIATGKLYGNSESKEVTGYEITGVKYVQNGNGNTGKLSGNVKINYIELGVKDVTISGTEGQDCDTIIITDDAVKAALAKAGVNGEIINVSYEAEKATPVTTTSTYTTYGYKAIDYLIKTVSVSVEDTPTETKELYKLVFSKVADTARTEYRNDNWYTGNILLAEFENETYTTDGNGGGDYTYTNPGQKPVSVTDETVKANNSDFRSKIDNCAEVAAQYAALAEKAAAAQRAVNLAAGEVEELEAQLNKLGKEADLKELKEFTTKISDAKQRLSDAEAIKDSIVSKFDNLEKDFQEKVWEAVNDNNVNGDGTKDDDSNGTNNGGTSEDGTNDDGGNGTNDSGTTDDVTNDDDGNGNGNGTDDGDDNGDDNGSGTETEPEPEANEESVNGGESGSDNGTTDNGTTDNGTTDNGTTDNGTTDNGTTDNGTTDNGTTDNGTTDNGTTDNGTTDNGTTDNGTTDNGTTDNGTNDNGTTDNGTTDNGTTDNGAADNGNVDGGNSNVDGGNSNVDGGNANVDGGDANANVDGGNANGDGGNANVDGGNANADGGNANADGGNANDGGNADAAGDNANADGGNANAEGGNGNGEQTETIGDEDSALAGSIGGAADNAGIVTVNIGDDDSALAGTIQTKRKWNWWWLLIVAAVTGGTTYGIAKGNQKKKEQADNGSDNN